MDQDIEYLVLPTGYCAHIIKHDVGPGMWVETWCGITRHLQYGSEIILEPDLPVCKVCLMAERQSHAL